MFTFQKIFQPTKYFLVFGLLLTFTSFTKGQDLQNIKETVGEIVKNSRTPGASVLIAKDGEIILDEGYGMANLNFDVPTTNKTKYYFVGPSLITPAVAVLQLIEQKKIALDDRVYDIIPGLHEDYKKVKIKHLLNFTSGVPDYHYLGDKFYIIGYPYPLDDIMGLFSHLPLMFEPGDRYDWSVSNSILLCKVVEVIAKQSFEDYFQKYFIEKLGLSETVYLDPIHLPVKNMATGHEVSDKGPVIFSSGNLYKYGPSSQYATTTGDVFRLWMGIVEGKLVPPGTYNLMKDKKEIEKNNSYPFGYGTRYYDINGHQYIGMRATLEGYSSSLFHSAEGRHTIIVLANSWLTAGSISSEISRFMIDPYNYDVSQNQVNSATDLPLSDKLIRDYTGTYLMKMDPEANVPLTYINHYKQTCRIFLKENHLWMQSTFHTYPKKLLLQEDGSFVAEVNGIIKVSFEKTKNSTSLTTIAGPYVLKGAKTGGPSGKVFYETIAENILED